MTQVDIFAAVNPEGEFFKFAKVGDGIKGTYVGKKDIPGRGNFAAQIGYNIKDTDGKIWIVAQSLTKKIFHERMNEIFLGQIVGFRFDRIKPSTTPGLNPANIINIYADPKYVDQAWIDAMKSLESSSTKGQASVGRVDDDEDEEIHKASGPGSVFGDKPFVMPADAQPSEGGLPKSESDIDVKDIDFGQKKEGSGNEALDAIRNLARTKGLTNEGMSQADADATIEKYTELKLEEANLTKIIIKLTGYVAK